MELTHESGVIGSILLDPKAIGLVADIVKPDDFTVEQYRTTYTAALSLYREGKPIDPVALKAEARKQAPALTLDDRAMIELMEITPTARNAREHAKGMKNDANTVRVRTVLESAILNGGDPDEIIDSVVEQLTSIQRGSKSKRATVLKDMMSNFVQWLTNDKQIDGIELGYPRLDRMLRGLAPGDLTLLAARPAVGKSALAGNIGLNAARSGKRVLVFSAEMAEIQYSQRFIANWADVDLDKVLRKDKAGEDGKRMAKATLELGKFPLHVYDHPAISVYDVRRELQRLKDVELVIIDYVQLMQSAEKCENRNLEVAKISGGLKILAREFDVPILALAQLNRTKGEYDEPSINDLRDSGALEQDADKVMMLWKLEEAAEGELQKVGLKVGKNRMGQTGTVVMYFDGAHMRHTETAEEYVPEQGKGRRFKKVSGNDPNFPWGA